MRTRIKRNIHLPQSVLTGFIALLSLLLATISQAQESSPPPLELIKAFPINGPKNFQPSGLTWCRNNLLTVSDRHNETIFTLKINDQDVSTSEYITMMPPNLSVDIQNSKALDWEGIACGPKDHIFVTSEALGRILRINLNNKASWFDEPSIDEIGIRLGLFKNDNAKIEGIAWGEGRTFYIAAERSPRGLMGLQAKQTKILQWKSHVFPNETINGRTTDFSGLHFQDKKLYTIERNHNWICRRDPRRHYKEEACWSYEHVERSEEYHYENTYYGIAEGMTVHNQVLYIVTDNNNEVRKNDSDDPRAQLFTFKLPDGW